jgi:(p)ppGpp synthase/HD superfamily hydrolase
MKYLRTFESYTDKEKYRLRKFINKVKSAYKFAEDAHSGVKRKGGDPYFTHPDAVAKIVHEVKNSEYIADLIAAAYLHDTVEDVEGVTVETIREIFGDLVASLVGELTSDLDKIAISGKEEYLIDKMLNMSSWALVIKLADRLHNLNDFKEIMAGNDEKRKKWVRKYAEQTKNIVDELEWYRKLSKPQKKLVDKIRHKLKIVI